MEIYTEQHLRLRTLRDYKVLDTVAEQVYDDITSLAAMICRTPISLVSLIDKDRQWFKSRRGTSLEETPLSTSICACVAAQGQTLIVPDASKDLRFMDMELVKGPPFIRFYAGAPLVTPDGVMIGALCVIDLEPRLLTSEQVLALEALARQVMGHLELHKSKMNSQDQQSKLNHKTKLASIGEMAAKIAHEINNPLTIINGNVGLLRRILGQRLDILHPKSQQYLDSIEKTVHRIDKIVRGLKALSRDGLNDPFEDVDLTASIINANSLVREKFIYHGIELRQQIPISGARLECRSVQIEQILINCLNNSFDAVREQDEKWVEIQVHDAGDVWRIKVIDSGPGIPTSFQERLMQPFFTTKEFNYGTGLGLSISKAIAEEHGGSLEFDKNSHHTCFVLTLPKKQFRR